MEHTRGEQPDRWAAGAAVVSDVQGTHVPKAPHGEAEARTQDLHDAACRPQPDA